jgi:hypothetical protein
MASVFWFSRLKDDVDAATYEDWVQRTDYRLALEIPCIKHYRVHRVEGSVDGEGVSLFDYIEVLEITDMKAYRAAMKDHPALQQIVAEIGSFMEAAGSAWGAPIEPLGKEQ